MFGKEQVSVENKVKCFAIYDSKAVLYTFPFPALTAGVAIRQFTELCNNKDHPIGKHPEDYILFEIGDFNETKGFYNNLSAPVSLGVGSGYVNLVG